MLSVQVDEESQSEHTCVTLTNEERGQPQECYLCSLYIIRAKTSEAL